MDASLTSNLVLPVLQANKLPEEKVQCLSAQEELSIFREKNKQHVATFCAFSFEEFKYLQMHKDTIHSESPQYQFLIEKYNVYLNRVLYQFERGPKGLSSNLDDNGSLKVLTKSEMDRMLLLGLEFTRKSHQSAIVFESEFYALYEKYGRALRKMAADAQGRGLDCWVLTDSEPSRSYQGELETHSSEGLRKRVVFDRK